MATVLLIVLFVCSHVGSGVLVDDNVQAQLHQLELKYQTLLAEVTKLQNDKQLMEAQMQALTTLVNARKPACQSGAYVTSDPTGHAQTASTVVHFNPPFDEVPKVTWGTTALDFDHDHNIRLNTFVVNLNSHNFTLNMNTWADTGLFGVTIQWMACPAHI